MTLFSSFTYPGGKDLDPGKVITNPSGLLDFNLCHFPVCGYFPLWRPELQCKERQQRILTHCATFPKGASREQCAGKPMGALGVRKLKCASFQSWGNRTSQSRTVAIHWQFIMPLLEQKDRKRVLKEMHLSKSLSGTRFFL